MKTDPEALTSTDANGVLMEKARASLEAEDLTTALSHAQAAVRAGGGAPAHLILGKVYYASKNYAAAEREFGSAGEGDSTAREELER